MIAVSRNKVQWRRVVSSSYRISTTTSAAASLIFIVIFIEDRFFLSFLFMTPQTRSSDSFKGCWLAALFLISRQFLIASPIEEEEDGDLAEQLLNEEAVGGSQMKTMYSNGNLGRRHLPSPSLLPSLSRASMKFLHGSLSPFLSSFRPPVVRSALEGTLADLLNGVREIASSEKRVRHLHQQDALPHFFKWANNLFDIALVLSLLVLSHPQS